MPEDLLSEDEIRGLFKAPSGPPQLDIEQPRFGLGPNLPREDTSFKPSYEKVFTSENKQGEIPLDIESGAPTWQRIKGSFAHSPELTIKFWQDLYGTQNVRPAMYHNRPTGGLILRTVDEKTNKPKDVLVDEENFSLKDLGEMAGAVPELIGGIAATILAKRGRPGAGLYGAARNIVAGGAGAETAGFLKDLAMGEEAQKAYDERLKAFGSDLRWGPIFDIAARGLGRVITPFSREPEPIYEQGKQASEFFKGKYGVEMPYSTAEKTGIPIIGRTEVEMKRLPGGGAAYADLRSEQQANAERIMNRVQGLSTDADAAERAAIPSEEEIGRQAIQQIRTSNQSVEDAVRTARNEALDKSQGLISRALNQQTSSGRQMFPDLVGKSLHNRAQYERNQFQSEANRLYDAAKSLPGGQDRILVTPSLPNKAAQYLKSLPSKEKIIETVGYDQYGSPVAKTATGTVPMGEFIPPNVIGKLNELASVGKTKWSLQDLIAMRNEVSNDIAQGESIPGVQTHHLKNIRNMLTESIDESTSAIPDKALRNAWMQANGYYAKNVEKFQTKLASRLLKNPNDPGYVGPNKLAEQVLSGADDIMEAKNFLGAASREYGQLRQHLADFVYQNSLKANGRLDAKQFISDLKSLRKNNFRAFDEVFGKYGNSLLDQASQMDIGAPTRYGASAARELESEFIDAGVRSPNSQPHLRKLIAAQKAQDEIYQNQVRQWIGSENVPGTVKPGDFVQKFLRAPGKGGASPEEARKAMDLLSPDMQTKVQNKMIENILDQAGRAPTEVDKVALRLDPDRVINSESLLKILGNHENQRLFETVLTKDRYEDLIQMARMMRPIEQKQAAYAGAAGLAAGAAVSGFLTGKVSNFARKSTIHKLIATFLTSAPARAYLEQTAEPLSATLNVGGRNLGSMPLSLTGDRRNTFIAAVVGSESFWKNLVEDYGEAGAKKALREITTEFNISPQGQQQQQGSPQQPMGEDQIRQMLR